MPVDPSGRAGPTKGQAVGRFWRRSSPGLYVPSSVDAHDVAQRIFEHAQRLPPSGAVSGWASLRWQGAGYFDGIAPDGRTIQPVALVVPPEGNVRVGPGCERHRDRLDPDDVAPSASIRVTRPVRATFDEARWAPNLKRAVIVLDMALATGLLTPTELASYLTGRTGWLGLPQVRKALPLADTRSMSPKETELRLLWMLDLGLPRPRCNWPIADENGRVIGKPDLLSEELALVIEFDGAEHRSRSRHRDDLRRDDRFREVGLEPVRFVGADLSDIRLVTDRLRAAVGRSTAASRPRRWMLRANPPPVW